MLATMNLLDYLDLTMMAVTMKATPKNYHQAMTVTPQETSSSEEDETGDDSEQTNPLLGQIRDRVNGALSASGMLGPVF